VTDFDLALGLKPQFSFKKWAGNWVFLMVSEDLRMKLLWQILWALYFYSMKPYPVVTEVKGIHWFYWRVEAAPQPTRL